MVLLEYIICFASWVWLGIAQLVERRTVVGSQLSLGRWFNSGSRELLLQNYYSRPGETLCVHNGELFVLKLLEVRFNESRG